MSPLNQSKLTRAVLKEAAHKYYPGSRSGLILHDVARAVQYPEHGFMIDYDEAQSIGLSVEEPTPEQSEQLDLIVQSLPGIDAFGKVVCS